MIQIVNLHLDPFAFRAVQHNSNAYNDEAFDDFLQEFASLAPDEQKAYLVALEAQMQEASQAMDFERAAGMRDQLVRVKSYLEGTSSEHVLQRLRASARSGSQYATRRSHARRRKKH